MVQEEYLLTPEQVTFFDENGYIQIRNLLTKDEVAEFQQAFTDAVSDKRGRFFSDKKVDK